MNKKKAITILIVIATVILAGVAIFTAIRLYQLRKEAVAPTAPERPEAAAPVIESCTQLAFTIGEEPTPTPTPTPGVTPTPTPTPTGTPTPTPTPGVTPTPTPTPTSSPTASPTTSPIAQASPTSSPGATVTPLAQASPGASPETQLPEAGISYPTIFGVVAGILFLIISLALAL